MTYRVKIRPCLTNAFQHAHAALIESLGGSYSVSRKLSPWQVMKEGWQKQYNVKPVMENGIFKYLDFENEQQYTLFVLKWS